jgi:hypothetical protein
MSLRPGAAVWLLAVLALAGCTQGPVHTGPEVPVGAGVLPTGDWTAWVYRSVDSGLCLQIRVDGRDPSTICGLEGSGTSIWRPDTPVGPFVGGVTSDDGASSAWVTFADGSVIRGPVARATAVSDLGFFAVPVEAAAPPSQLDIHQDDASVIESIALK